MAKTIARNYKVPPPGSYSPKSEFTDSVITPRVCVNKVGKQKVDILEKKWCLRENSERPGPGRYEIKGGFD